MGYKLEKAALPLDFDNYVFDLYGTLVDIHTEEAIWELWEKLALFYGYYGAAYTPGELKARYEELVRGRELALKQSLEEDPRYSHEASPEIELTGVFAELFREKGVTVQNALAVHAGQFFRVLSTQYVRLYPGTLELLRQLRQAGKGVYLLSNAQRIFTEYEMRYLGLLDCFDGILISSDHRTKKPDVRFFNLLLERFALNPAKTLFVGNDSRTDIGGAGQVGMHTYYVRSNISPVNDHAEYADWFVEDFTRWEPADME